MKLQHFELLQPVCPGCRQRSADTLWPLRIESRLRGYGEVLLEGRLTCSNPQCLAEFPVIDGVPVLVPDVAGYVANHLGAITRRADLTREMVSLIGDCCGPASEYDTQRQQLSTYGWSHFADLDPTASGSKDAAGQNFLGLLDAALSLCGDRPPGPVIDIGCGPGRSSWQLAERYGTQVLGIDLNFSFLRVAQEILNTGRVHIDRRKIGLAYEAREFIVDLPASEQVDFWCCDALALPFSPEQFSVANCLNVLDCVHSPVELLQELQRGLAPGGWLVASSPYDWSGNATSPSSWIGGHSDRGELHGAAEPLLRKLLTPGEHPQSLEHFRWHAESESIDWTIRIHDRSQVKYQVHAFTAQKRADH
jgi:SAM-dependent methyltransferase/uncharacterized protein YbaR (Trm112 family)